MSLLLFKPNSRFRDLNVDIIPTDQFSYHLRVLLKMGLIKKEGIKYFLTSKGKMIAEKLDTAAFKIEKQPKVSVILIPYKIIGGKKKYLIQERTKEPYFGYKGFIAGKVKFGETLAETAKRELEEESGLSGKFRYCYEIHEMVYDRTTREQLEDKFFHIIECYDLEGKLEEKTVEGVVEFVTVKEFRKMVPKYHNEDDLLTWYLRKDFSFKEQKYVIDKF